MTNGQHRPQAGRTEHRPQNVGMVAIELSANTPVVWRIMGIPGPRAPDFEYVFADGTVVPKMDDLIIIANQFIREQRVKVAYVEPDSLEFATPAGFTLDIWNVYVHKEVV